MKANLILTLYYALVGILFFVALWGSGVLNLKPPPDIANLEARVAKLEEIVRPDGKLIMPDFEKARP